MRQGDSEAIAESVPKRLPHLPCVTRAIDSKPDLIKLVYRSASWFQDTGTIVRLLNLQPVRNFAISCKFTL
ncbi:MAG: hypothetical protein P8J66_06500, partial [Verrucomicrobiota bacterium]|nr:hypothetical protein [Verrucomicrobiota bacterium]